jgi:hypothetical protein
MHSWSYCLIYILSFSLLPASQGCDFLVAKPLKGQQFICIYLSSYLTEYMTYGGSS